MTAAEAQAHTTGDHLSRAEEENGGPIVHYAFGALAGGIYGALAEYSSTVTSGFGTSFGGALFRTADSLAIPALNLAPLPSDQPASAQRPPSRLTLSMEPRQSSSAAYCEVYCRGRATARMRPDPQESVSCKRTIRTVRCPVRPSVPWGTVQFLTALRHRLPKSGQANTCIRLLDFCHS